MTCPEIPLTQIDISALKLVKETVAYLDNADHSRWVFRSQKGFPLAGGEEAYVKIWNPGHVRAENVRRALEAGFYDESMTPALKGVIVHNSMCRGYIMARCAPNPKMDPSFYALIQKKTAETGFFNIQFSRFHVMRYGSVNSLIDLEGVYHISELPNLRSCYFDSREYQYFVRALLMQDIPATLQAPRTSLPRPIAKARNIARNILREASIKWRAMHPRTYLLELPQGEAIEGVSHEYPLRSQAGSQTRIPQ